MTKPPWPEDEADRLAAIIFDQAEADAIERVAAAKAAAQAVAALADQAQSALQRLAHLRQLYASALRLERTHNAETHALWRLICLMAPDLVRDGDVVTLEHKLIGLAGEICRDDEERLTWLKGRIDRLIEDLESGE